MSKEFEEAYRNEFGIDLHEDALKGVHLSIDGVRRMFQAGQAAAESRGIAKGRIEGLRRAAEIAGNVEQTHNSGYCTQVDIISAILSAAASQEIAGEGCETYQAACAAVDGKGEKG